MKKLAIIFTIVFISLAAQSQDLLYFSNGNILKVNTIEQNSEGVTFTLYNSTNVEVFNANKEELIRIIKQNGDVVTFDGIYRSESDISFPKNRVAFNVLHAPQGIITMKYEFLNKTGNLGFEIPMSVGLLEDTYLDPIGEIFNREFYSLFYTGLTLNWYPVGQKRVSYVLGPSLRLGIGKDQYYYYYDSYYSEPKEEYYSKLLINNGLILNPSDHFSISFMFSLGIMHHNAPPEEYKFRTVADASINLAFRF
ncbi:MAG: hypothetical protein C0598_01800 [Marinilabiliales bacterium]|nr:MAG: hypothetical protein C0598_01800 [Marinilabiliales bacterium]